MSRLILRKNGHDILQIPLEIGKEYIGGRDEQSQIYLDVGDLPGISRRHFRVFYDNNQWRIETLSRHGNVYYRGLAVQTLLLSHEDMISIAPFEVLFLEDKNQINEHESLNIGSDNDGDREDKTNVISMRTYGTLKVQLAGGKDLGTFILEGNSWICGRETSCQIYIDHAKLSRRHFEIRNAASEFVIRDLGSVNGTLLNQQLISSDSWHALRSGDVIQVADVIILFEVRDALFDQKNLGVLDLQDEIKEVVEIEQEPLPVGSLPPTLDQTPSLKAKVQSSHKHGIEGWWHEKSQKQKRFYLLIGVILIVFLLLMLPDQKKKQTEQAKESSESNQTKGSGYTAEQKMEFDQILDRAKTEIAANKFDVALQSLHSLHEKTKNASYEGSKELEIITIEKRKSFLVHQELEKKEKENVDNQKKIADQVRVCRSKVSNSTQMKDIEDCLMPVITLDPSNAEIEKLKKDVEQLMTDRQLKEVQRRDQQQRVQQLKSMYQSAMGLLSQGKPKAAIDSFQLVVQSTLPDPESLKVKANSQIQQIKKQQAAQLSQWLKEIHSAKEGGDLKGAYSILLSALQQEPESDELLVKQQQILNELKKKMQSIFQEAILEENIGEVDSARAKWKKIMESSVPDEDYYKKAKKKLKKYEPVY